MCNVRNWICITESAEIYFFYSSPQISHNIQGIHYRIVNLKKFVRIQWLIAGITCKIYDWSPDIKLSVTTIIAESSY